MSETPLDVRLRRPAAVSVLGYAGIVLGVLGLLCGVLGAGIHLQGARSRNAPTQDLAQQLPFCSQGPQIVPQPKPEHGQTRRRNGKLLPPLPRLRAENGDE